MSIKLKLELILVSFVIIFTVLFFLKKDKIPVKYALVWIFSALIIFFVAVATDFFNFFSKMFGFVTISNMIIGLFIFLLLMICMSLTIMISSQKVKITRLTQEISLLKSKMN